MSGPWRDQETFSQFLGRNGGLGWLVLVGATLSVALMLFALIA